MRRLLILAMLAMGALIALASAASAQEAESGQEVYERACGACHQPDGAGIPGSFPPLAGNPNAADADYVETVIRDGLAGSIEVLGVIYDGQMPAVAGLSDAEIAVVVAHVELLAGDDTTTPTSLAPPQEGSTTAGEDLFVGRNALENGGVACAACHTAGDVTRLGGPGLGPDLTDLFSRYGGGAGVAAVLVNPPSPTMAPVFSDHPLTSDEVSNLVAFFEQAEQDGPGAGPELLGLLGGIGLAALIGFMALVLKRPRTSYPQKLRSTR